MSDLNKPNHYFNDSLGDPATCTDDHNHPEPEIAFEAPNLPSARLEWQKLPDGRIVGSVNGYAVYTVRLAGWAGECKVFHRLPVKPIDGTFKTSDLAKLYADTHLHRAMRVLGFVAR